MTTPSELLARTRRAASRHWSDDEAVSEVVGQVLLVGITITTMVGLTILVMNIDGPLDKTHADIEYLVSAGQGGWNDGDESIQLTHMGGESIETASTLFRIVVNGAVTEVDSASLGGAWADGSFSITETWIHPIQLAFGDEIEVLLINTKETTLTSSTVLTAGASSVGGQPVLTYVSQATAIDGLVTLLPNAQDPDDGQAEADLSEAAVTSTISDRVGVKHSFSSVSNSGDDLLTSNNIRTRFNSLGDFVEIDGFTNVAGATGVQKVEVILEGQRPADGGADPAIKVSYKIGATAGGTDATYFIDSIGSDKIYGPFDITGTGRSLADIQNLEIRIERLSVNTNFAHADLDAAYLRVTYSLSGSSMEVDFQFNNVPGGLSHQVELEYRVVNDDFTVSVWDGTVWVKRGLVLNQGSPTVWTYTLTPDEYNGGTVLVKFRDKTPGGATPGQILIDFARVRTI